MGDAIEKKRKCWLFGLLFLTAAWLLFVLLHEVKVVALVLILTLFFVGPPFLLMHLFEKANEERRSRGAKPKIIMRMAAWAIAFVVFQLALAFFIATYSPSDYRIRAYNSAALSDLMNVRIGLECYLADTHAYPDRLEDMDGTYLVERTKEVDIVYDKLGKERYRLFITHKKGSKEYQCSSDETMIYWRDKHRPNAAWQHY
ncbi:MAG: hypothetical protein OEW15_10030 [Nitrospirota bacterium]|nr:hypothetical protein [Nitrospirota bacterium]